MNLLDSGIAKGVVDKQERVLAETKYRSDIVRSLPIGAKKEAFFGVLAMHIG